MPVPVIMPKFEMAQESGKVLRWLKQEGEAVTKGEAILEVETDKVAMEVEAPASGTLVGIRVGPGEVVPIGQPIAYILLPGEAWTEAPAASSAPASSPSDVSGHVGGAQLVGFGVEREQCLCGGDRQRYGAGLGFPAPAW